MVQVQDALLNHHELALQADGKEAWAFLTAAGEPYQFFWPAAVELAFVDAVEEGRREAGDGGEGLGRGGGRRGDEEVMV